MVHFIREEEKRRRSCAPLISYSEGYTIPIEAEPRLGRDIRSLELFLGQHIVEAVPPIFFMFDDSILEGSLN